MRKVWAGFVCAAFISPAVNAIAYTWCGDVNCDRKVTASDALAVLKSSVDGTAQIFCPLDCPEYFPKPTDLPSAEPVGTVRTCADFNCDGRVTATDAFAALLHVLDQERRLSCTRSCPGDSFSFAEVTSQSGIHHVGDSWGGAWGDYDADGWPDLWVTNHFEKSSLYRNLEGRGFEETTDEVVVPVPVRADSHAAAWADFDNDGDLDLFEQIGGGGGTASASHPMPKHLYVNENGVLYERAAEYGVDYPYSRGRGISWLDLNTDGRLDLLLLTELRPDHLYPSAMLFQQPQGDFLHVSETLGFDVPLSSKYAYLCDLTGTGEREIIIHGGNFPQRIYRAGQEPLAEMRRVLGFPVTNYVEDSAAGDFDGDLDIDFFLARNLAVSEFDWRGDSVVRAFLFPYLTTDEHGFAIRTNGDVSVELQASQIIDPNLIHIGQAGYHPSGQRFVLRTDDARNVGLLAHEPGTVHGVLIGWDPRLAQWTIRAAVPPDQPKQRLFNVEIASNAAISAVEPININTTAPPQVNKLLVNTGASFVDGSQAAGINFPTDCHSVTSGDFDNDMDLDLYLVCTRRVRNVPDLFLENRGDGSFVTSPYAAGAQGSMRGLGDVALAADYNRDGFLDLFVTNGHPLKPFNSDGPDQLYVNDGNSNHWLELNLVGVRSNRDAIGATIVLTAGGVSQTRQTGCTSHKWAFDERIVHFGLGGNTTADIAITWPSGTVQLLQDVQGDRLLTVTEPPGA